MTKLHPPVGRAGQNGGSPCLGALPSTVLSDPAPLIGRERELEAIRALLLGASVRLVTLTGPGGIGKTRLALAAARCVEPAFPDGAWFVDLAPLHDAGGVDTAIGQALKIKEAGALPPADRVTTYLKDRRLLLILDNFEHVLPAAARVADLLAAAPQLKVLATSREPLNLLLEHRFPLGGLTLPDLRSLDPASVAQAPAAALFLEHARRIQPDLALTQADASALAELLHRLDGLPLAIRIAAAHSHVLSPAAMLARFQGQALLSTEEARDVPGRHHTLRDAIDWSYGLLSATEQAAFRQLGVFVGGWTLEAAEAVIQERESASPTWAILGLLVDKSVVQTNGASNGDRRYRMLQPIREYALERLRESGELDAARDRHVGYYLTLAKQAEAEYFGAREGMWLYRLEAEHENLRAALRWAAERRDGELSLRLAVALMDFWAWRGSVREGRRWLQDARALGVDSSAFLRAKALAGEGLLAMLQSDDYSHARTLLQEGLALAEALHDRVLMATILSRLGAVALLQGEASDARALLEQSLVLSRGAGDSRNVVFALVELGRTFILLEDLERAEATLTEGLNLARGTGSTQIMAFALTSLAQLKLRRRNDTAAAGLGAAALGLARATESRRAIMYAVGIAALMSGHHGDVERAVRLLAAVEGWTDWTGEVMSPTYHDHAAYAALHTRARRQMGDAAYRAAVAEAQAMSMDQVADLAQACFDPAPPRPSERIAAAGAPRPRPLLSDREQAVLRLIGEGLPNKQIATALSIAERTVKSHVASAMNKLGVDNRAHAAVTAIQRGLL
ncbi:MAG TPA: LuxR C-terminal-related transcriptional regulator [bacterium]|nr:LuxR C-terminal-related transcriptional regulator [bacterium]